MQLQIFSYNSDEQNALNEIRTLDIEGEIWFVAVDVAAALGYAKPRNAINTHCKASGLKKSLLQTTSSAQEVLLINEPNVYRLIIKSRLPSAEKFETWLFEKVIPSIRHKGYYGSINRNQLPNYIERYKDNYHKLPNNYFSVISEMYARLYLALEKVGYSIPDKAEDGKQIMPDISVGKGFAKFLKDNKSSFYDNMKKYTHVFPNGKEVEANMYHIDALPLFIRYIHEKWIPENAESYFKKRDPLALDYLPKLLGQ